MAQRMMNSHPYFPQDIEIPTYIPNKTSIPALLLSFGSILAICVLANLFLARHARKLSTYDQLTFCWFILCAFLHLFFEGYFVLNHTSIPASQSLFAQLWKEYALSDSRYVVSDPFMLCIESLTVALWGPLCVAIAICIARGSNLSTPLQIIMCVGHLYGVLLYFGTCFYEMYYRGVSHSRPEVLYYWVYFVGMNFPWVVVPLVILTNDVKLVYRAMTALQQLESRLRTDGVADDQTKGDRKVYPQRKEE